MSYKVSFFQFVFFTTAMVIVLPAMIVSLSIWYRFRSHYIVAQRFPPLTSYIIVCCFMTLLMKSLQVCMVYYEIIQIDNQIFDFISDIFAFNAFGFIVYRAIVVTLKLRVAQQQMIAMTQISVLPNRKRSSMNYKKVIHHTCANVFSVYVVIGSLSVFIMDVYDLRGYTLPLWGVLTFLGLALVFYTVYYRLQDALGCLVESYMYIVVTLTITIYSLLFSVDQLYGEIYAYFTFITDMISFHIVLLNSLFLIYQNEGTLSFKKYQLRHKLVKTSMPKMGRSESVSRSKSHSFSYPERNMQADLMNLNPELEIVFVSDVTDFLRKQHHYQVFGKYLGLCFAIENLFFVERVTIFHHIIHDVMEEKCYCENRISPNTTHQSSNKRVSVAKKIRTETDSKSNGNSNHNLNANDSQSEDNQIEFTDDTITSTPKPGVEVEVEVVQADRGVQEEADEDEDEEEEEVVVVTTVPVKFDDKQSRHNNSNRGKSLYSNKFKFLSSLYSEYREAVLQEMKNVKKSNSGKFENFNVVFQMYQEICDEFIYDDSPQQVNIRSNIKKKLLAMLNTEDNNHRFESIYDFLHIFDAAMTEAYFLLSSIYGRQFKSYVKKTFPGRWKVKERKK